MWEKFGITAHHQFISTCSCTPPPPPHPTPSPHAHSMSLLIYAPFLPLLSHRLKIVIFLSFMLTCLFCLYCLLLLSPLYCMCSSILSILPFSSLFLLIHSLSKEKINKIKQTVISCFEERNNMYETCISGPNKMRLQCTTYNSYIATVSEA
jgi:hypothetical protein